MSVDTTLTPWSVSLVAWGEPSHPRTFSGYSRYLGNALRRYGVLRREFSNKLVRASDALCGAVALRVVGGRIRAEVRRGWMWSDRGSRALDRRLAHLLRDSGDRGPMLQVGTLTEVPPDVGPHYVLTDMTIPQAHRAGMFSVARMSPRARRQAIEVQHRVFRQAAHIFTLTDWTKQSVVEDFGQDPALVTVVHAGSNLVFPTDLVEPKREREILFVGIDWERKGGPLLLKAFRRLRSRLPGATLRVVGCSPTVRENGVILEGYLDKSDPKQQARLARLYLGADCFCLPSLFDPFPNAIIEAASVGLATVAIDNGSRREAIIDGQTGVLAKEPTADAVCEALFALLRDVDYCRRLGAAARERAEREFTWDRVVEKIGAVVVRRSADIAASDRGQNGGMFTTPVAAVL